MILKINHLILVLKKSYLMYKIYFEESFFEWLNDFVLSMKNYYFNFYSNTWIYDEDKIVELYFEKYENS